VGRPGIFHQSLSVDGLRRGKAGPTALSSASLESQWAKKRRERPCCGGVLCTRTTDSRQGAAHITIGNCGVRRSRILSTADGDGNEKGSAKIPSAAL
jgi:hypothetical protein